MFRTQSRQWVAAGAAGAVLLALAGWVLVVGPQRATASDHWAELAGAQAQTAALRVGNANLSAQMDQIEDKRVALALEREALPQSNSLDALVAAVSNNATTAGVTVLELTAIEPVDISASAGAAAADPALADETTAVDTTAGTAPSGLLYALPVTLRASGPLANLQEYLRLLQSEQPRAILFRTIVMTVDEGSSSLAESAVLAAETQVYVSPGASTAVAGAAAG